MIWLASFPRSGNTFFRNVLHEVYGIESSTYHQETTYPVDDNYNQYQFVKTHLLPHQLEPKDPAIKSVYLVRDGRDALVSMAHHRKDLVETNSDFDINLLEAIIAPKGSHFGGWSENVRQWSRKADIIIRFEDLIADPIGEIEKLRSITHLPEPQINKLPTFKSLKYGTPKYGSGRNLVNSTELKKRKAKRFFRKGKVGGYKEEMSPALEELFWSIHGEVMVEMKYTSSRPKSAKRVGQESQPYRVLVEANKLKMDGNDGIKRYTLELLDNLMVMESLLPDKWQIDLYLQGGHIVSLREQGSAYLNSIVDLLDKEQQRLEKLIEIASEHKSYEENLLDFKAKVKKALPPSVYNTIGKVYRNLPIRAVLRTYRNSLTKKEIESHQATFEKYDLIHVPLPQNFHFVKDIPAKYVVTVHDLTHRSHPEFHTRDNIKLSEAGMQQVKHKNAHLIAISQATKADIKKAFPEIDDDRISVIYEACNRSHFRPVPDGARLKTVLEKYSIPDLPYFLTLSTLEPRKNLLRTIQAFDQLKRGGANPDLILIICGKKGWKIDKLLHAKNINYDNIYFTGFVDEADLPVFYSNALALCYVSLYEGFGLPPMEAMSSGTTVIYGDNSSMPEIIGDAGLPADAYDVADIKAQMLRVLDERLREELKIRAIQRAYQFSWLKTAWETLNVYEKCIQR